MSGPVGRLVITALVSKYGSYARRQVSKTVVGGAHQAARDASDAHGRDARREIDHHPHTSPLRTITPITHRQSIIPSDLEASGTSRA